MAVMGFARDEWGRSAARKRVRVAALVALLAVLAALGVPTSAEAEISPPDCPEQQILDQAEVEALTPGTQLVGLTVEAGDAPTAIDFVVETVQRGLLGANAPLVIVRATSGSPATKGIWFGMSGSPVYTIDDRGDPEALVGAVAFGLAFGSSPLAGLQPGYAMETVRGYAPASVTVSAAVASRLAASTGLSARTVRRFEPLSVPLTLSGTRTQRLPLIDRAAQRAGLGVAPVAGAQTSANAASTSASLAAGDSFAAALSYGYLTAAGIGTTTFVCGDRAMAFGHPFFFEGPTHLGANAAANAFVVEDTLFGPYKLAEIAGTAGVVDQDRAAGVRARLGNAPQLMPVRSTVNAPDINRSDIATTQIAGQRHVPFLGFLHTLNHLDDTADMIGAGSSRVVWTITGTTGAGVPFEVVRRNRFTSRGDITLVSTFELLDALDQLQNQPFRRVRFTGVRVNAEVREQVLEHRVRDVRVWRNGAWRRPAELRVRPGEVLRLQVRLFGGGGRAEEFQIRIPRGARGVGELVASGRSADGFDEAFVEECMFGDCSEGDGGPTNFAQVLSSIGSAPRNDVLNLRMTVINPQTDEISLERHRRRVIDRVVTGQYRLPVVVVR
jgi:hypothetical protein